MARAVGMLTYFPAARPASARSPRALTSGYPETLSCFCRDRRRPRHKHQTSGGGGGGGDASPVRWELPGAVVGALAQRSSSAQTRSADVPRRRRWPLRSLRVTQFSPGPRQPGVGERRAGVHTRRRRAGRPSVRDSVGGHPSGRWRRPLLVTAGPRARLWPRRWDGG